MDWSLVIVSLLAAIAVFVPIIHRYTRYVGTLVHEVGHVLASILTGGGASSIRIRPDSSGEAGTSHRMGAGGAFSRTVTTLAGYATVINFGLLLTVLTFTPWVDYGVWVISLFSVIALLLIRNWFGLLVTVAFAGIMATFVFLPIPVTNQQVVFFFGIFLLFAGLQDMVQISRYTLRRAATDEQMSDFHILAARSLVPPFGWYLILCFLEILLLIVAIWLAISYSR